MRAISAHNATGTTHKAAWLGIKKHPGFYIFDDTDEAEETDSPMPPISSRLLTHHD